MTQEALFAGSDPESDDTFDGSTAFPTVIIIGHLTQEGILSKIRSLGYRYAQKVLYSSPENWEKIENYLVQMRAIGKVTAILIHLSESLILRMASNHQYIVIWRRLLSEIRKHKSLIFIYEDNMLGTFTTIKTEIDTFEEFKAKSFAKFTQSHQLLLQEDHAKSIQELFNHASIGKQILDETYQSDIEIVAYKKNADITMRVMEFLDDIDSGTFLRLYVPNGRYQAEQFAGLLKIFEDYIQRVEGKSFVIDTRKTESGVVYIFRSRGDNSTALDLDAALSRFDEFMLSCQNEPDKAEQSLVNIGISPISATSMVAKYSRNYQRILLDMRHEKQQKMLLLQQQMEYDILENATNSLFTSEKMLNSQSLFSLEGNSGTVNLTVNNINPQSTQIIDSIMYGNITYTNQDKELIKIFHDNLDKSSAKQLQSQLDQLNDKNTPSNEKQRARQRIMDFLVKMAAVLGESAVKGFASYLESRITGQQAP